MRVVVGNTAYHLRAVLEIERRTFLQLDCEEVRA
jgi:hypothetical protein